MGLLREKQTTKAIRTRIMKLPSLKTGFSSFLLRLVAYVPALKRRVFSQKTKLNIQPIDTIVCLLFVLLFAYLLTISYQKDGQISARSWYVWGTWPVHISYAARFEFFSPHNWFATHPLYSLTSFNYPFLIDLFSGLLLKAGFGYNFAHVYMWATVSIFALFSIYKLYMRYVGKKPAFIALLLFIFSGGFGFIYAKVLPVTYYWTDSYSLGIHWANTLAAQLAPQKSFFLGLLIFTIVFSQFPKNIYEKRFSRRKILALSLLSALLIISHTHSFIALVLSMLALVSLKIFAKNQVYKYNLIRYAFWSALFSLITFSLFLGTTVGSGFFQPLLGWMAASKFGSSGFYDFIRYQFLNWGIFILYILVLIKKNKIHKTAFGRAGILLFLVAHLVAFQPNPWDNTKLLTYSYLLLCPLIAQDLYAKVSSRKTWSKLLGFGLFITLTFSGFHDVVLSWLEPQRIMYDRYDLEAAQHLNMLADEGDVVASYDRVQDFVSGFTKSQMLMGYRGFLWTYGVDSTHMLTNLENLYAYPMKSSRIAEDLKIKFLVLGEEERKKFNASEFELGQVATKVFSNKKYVIYEYRDN